MKWSNMSIGMKLTIGFGAVLLLFTGVSGYSYLAFKQVDGLSNDVFVQDQLNAFMLEKEIDHLNWYAKLSDLFLRDDVTSVQVQTDDHKCGLGKWLFSEETQKLAAQDERIASLLNDIREPHRRLHESASKIGETYVAFDTSLDSMLAERWIDHLVWIEKLSNSLLTGVPFEGGLNPHECAFGKWYYSYKPADPTFESLLKEWEAPHTRLHESAEKIVDAMKRGDQEYAKKIYQEATLPALHELASIYEKTMGWVDATIQKQKDAKKIFSQETLSAVQETQHIIGQMRELFRGKAADATSTMGSRIAHTILVLSVASLLAILAGVMAAIVITRGITKPVNRVVEGLGESAEQVAAASGQVASASQELAEGSSEQAACLEETSSSLEEMSSMTKQNAGNAAEADQLMKEANRVVGDANKSMTELTTSMEAITTASEETSKIIKTIDEIAFQTNLLALNAAVEAARAGEAGAGFAVVADEVRNLAMRAANAAKNTAELIEGTVKKVREGSDLVAKTNVAFSEVAKSAARVGGLVGEIAAASNEQAQGIDQVNKAVHEMDKVVQQTAANAEESASASEEMNAQAEQMKSYVGDLVAVVRGASGRNGMGVGSRAQTKKLSTSSWSNKLRTGKRVMIGEKTVDPEQVIPFEDEGFSDF